MIINEHATAMHWDETYRQGRKFLRVTPEEVELFQLHVKTEPGMVAVDIGCGTGDWPRELASMGLEVTGYDFSAVAVAEASRLSAAATAAAKASGLNSGQGTARFIEWDVNSDAAPPFLEPHSVDIVTCRLVAAFLPMQRFLVRAADWLKPDGVVHIVTAVHERLDPAQKHRGLKERQIAKLGAGWKSVEGYAVTDDKAIEAIVLQHYA